jgi:hypothetical protein
MAGPLIPQLLRTGRLVVHAAVSFFLDIISSRLG